MIADAEQIVASYPLKMANQGVQRRIAIAPSQSHRPQHTGPTRSLITLPTLDLGEPKRPLVLQGQWHHLSILDVHRLVRDEVELVPPTERFGTEGERHLKVVSCRLRDVVLVRGVSGDRMWVSLDEVGDEDARAFEPPIANVEALERARE